MVGFRPTPLPRLAFSRVGYSSVGDDSLSVCRSTIRPISSGWIKSCTPLINPPLSDHLLPEYSTWILFRLSNRFLYPTFLFSLIVFFYICLLCARVSFFYLASCFFVFFFNVFFLTYLSPSSSLFLCPSVIIIIARSLKVWPSRYMSCAFLFCSSPSLQCQHTAS